MPESSCCQEDGDACGPFVEQEREIERLKLANEWLRYGLEEIVRGTDMRAGNGHAWEFGVAMDTLRAAGLGADGPGIQKPERRLD